MTETAQNTESTHLATLKAYVDAFGATQVAHRDLLRDCTFSIKDNYLVIRRKAIDSGWNEEISSYFSKLEAALDRHGLAPFSNEPEEETPAPAPEGFRQKTKAFGRRVIDAILGPKAADSQHIILIDIQHDSFAQGMKSLAEETTVLEQQRAAKHEEEELQRTTRAIETLERALPEQPSPVVAVKTITGLQKLVQSLAQKWNVDETLAMGPFTAKQQLTDGKETGITLH